MFWSDWCEYTHKKAKTLWILRHHILLWQYNLPSISYVLNISIQKALFAEKCLIHIKSNANQWYQMCVSVKAFNPNCKHTPRSNEDGIRADSRFVPSQWETKLLCICYLPLISQLLHISHVQFVDQVVRSWQRRSSEQKDLTKAYIRHYF